MKRKQYMQFGIIMLFAFLWFNNTYAQQYTQEDMNKVYIKFCNQEWESKHDDSILIEPWQSKNVRLCVSNIWDKQVEFRRGFSIAEYNSVWSRVCGDMTSDNQFAILIPETHERVMIISGHTDTIIEEKIIIPPGMSGLQIWCLLYKLAAPALLNLGSLFNIEERKYGYIDIVIWGESLVKNKIEILNVSWGLLSTNKKIKASIDKENNMNLSFFLENQGNISQNISLTWKIYNMLWFQKDFSMTPTTVAPGTTKELKLSVWMMPIYKWLFSVSMNIKSEPLFLFPISDEKLKQPWYYLETGNIFIFSRILVVVIIVFLLIIYSFFRRRKTIIVQQPSI